MINNRRSVAGLITSMRKRGYIGGTTERTGSKTRRQMGIPRLQAGLQTSRSSTRRQSFRVGGQVEGRRGAFVSQTWEPKIQDAADGNVLFIDSCKGGVVEYQCTELPHSPSDSPPLGGEIGGLDCGESGFRPTCPLHLPSFRTLTPTRVNATYARTLC